mmetsp:Transcript_22792/g.38180  ORF Transcript_22792/g.38180 Transcript_22792/m.38180 type:complete len:137 (-) Transcript_22792:44-454(-)
MLSMKKMRSILLKNMIFYWTALTIPKVVTSLEGLQASSGNQLSWGPHSAWMGKLLYLVMEDLVIVVCTQIRNHGLKHVVLIPESLGCCCWCCCSSFSSPFIRVEYKINRIFESFQGYSGYRWMLASTDGFELQRQE